MINTNLSQFTVIFDVLTAFFSKDSGREDVFFPKDGDTTILMFGTDHPKTQRHIAEDVTLQHYCQMSPSRRPSTARVGRVRLIVDSYSPIGKSLSQTP